MRLRFIGLNGSLGLKFGEIYRLTIHPWKNGVRITSPIICPYDSDGAFWREWAHPDADIRGMMEDRGQQLRQTHVPKSVPMKQCLREDLHGSHNWELKDTENPYAWCSGKSMYDKE